MHALSKRKPEITELSPNRSALWPFPYKPYKVYIAAPTTEQGRALRLGWTLMKAGFTVTSRWLEYDFDDLKNYNESAMSEVQRSTTWGKIDMDDVLEADTLVVLSSEQSTKGGYHVELGIFLGARRENILVVGNRRNVFYWTPEVRFMQSTSNTDILEFLNSPEHGKVPEPEEVDDYAPL